MRILLIILSCLLLIAVVITYHTTAELDKVRGKIKSQYEEEISALRSELLRSDSSRILLRTRLDSLGVANKDLLLQLSVTKQELSKVKGRYDHYTPTELEIEMMKRFKAHD